MRLHVLVLLLVMLGLLPGSSAQSPQDSSAQWMKSWHAAPVLCVGKIIKHTPKFEPTIDHASIAFELAVARQMRGRHAWEYTHHYPFLGFAFAYNDLGNDSVLGKATSIMPFIELPIAGARNLVSGATGFSATFRVGTGFAFISKYFDREDNPTNNVIASLGNNITQFAFTGQYKSSDRFTFFAGASLTHYSSGAVRVPNLGINIPAARFGIRYEPRPYASKDYLTHARLPVPRKIIFNIQTGIGFQESYPVYGPMYHVYMLEATAGRMIGRWNLLSAGSQVSYKEAAYAFIRQQEIYPDNYFANSLAVSGFMKDDFLFGPIGISASLGYYFYRPSPLQIGFYQKIGAYYSYVLKGSNNVQRLTAGVYLTAGDFTADYVSAEIGFRF